MASLTHFTIVNEIDSLTQRIKDLPSLGQSAEVIESVRELTEVLGATVPTEHSAQLTEQWTVQFQNGSIAASTFRSPEMADEYAEEMNTLIATLPDHQSPERFTPARLLKRVVIDPLPWRSVPGYEYGTDIEPGALIALD